jgi:type IV secretion system protein VirB10
MATRHPDGSDPRAFAHLQQEAGVKPVVALPRGGPPLWLMIGLIALAGLLLFYMLDARRRALTAPAVQVRAADGNGASAAPPPLAVLPEPVPAPVLIEPPLPVPPAPAPAPPPPAPPQIVYVPQAVPPPPPAPPAPPPRATNDPALVVDTGTPRAAAPAGAPAAAPAADDAANAAVAGGLVQSGGRARAGMFANRATTVVQGTLIPAVLETALDSTRPGLARAIVSRDVRGFDGSRVLIPRGSRLIGEYRSDVQPGQHRALVNWTRLIRPDGVTIAIGSPAADTVGGGGISAHVNSHFLARFAGAILQSILDVGVNLAGRVGQNNGAVVVLPGTLQGATQIVQPAQVTPTLTVRPGTSISIFVARDLDFTGSENRR